MQHPDYPTIDFKPAIARYDWDQTYDVLEFVHLPQGFYGLMPQVGIPCFELMAIDRFTPYRYLWEEQYSDYVYNFLKQFNFSPHNSILERLLRDESGELIKDSNNNNIVVPAFSFTGDKHSPTAEYKVTLSEGSYGVTGLVYQGWKDGVIGSIPTINQASYKFTLSQPTDVDLNKIINHWCQDDYPLQAWKFVNNELVETVPSDPQASLFSNNYDSQFCVNSLVLSKQVNGTWTEQSVATPHKFLFYSDIATYFTEVSDALMQYFDDIYNTYIDYFLTDKIASTNVYGGQGYPYSRCYVALSILPLQHYLKEINRVGSFTSFLGNFSLLPYNYVIDKLPSYFLDLCYLCRANNNKWGGLIYADLGTCRINNYPRYRSSDYFSIPQFRQSFIANLPANMSNSYRMLLAVNTSVTYPFFDAWSIAGEFVNPLGSNNKFSIQLASYYYPSAASGDYSTDAIFAQSPQNYFPVYCKEIRNNYIGTIGLPSELGNNQRLRLVEGDFIRGEFDENFDPYSTFDITDHDAPLTINKTVKIEIITLNEHELIESISTNVSDEDYLNYLLYTKEQLEEYMVDSIRIKEIHACLGAGEFSYYNDANGNPQPVYMNLCRLSNMMAKALGISFKLNGEIMSIRQSKHLNRGDTIPAGWYLGQFGRNEGASTVGQKGGLADEERLGIVYEVKGNRFETNQASGNEEITEGGYILCESIPQLIHVMLQDLDRSLGLQTLGSIAIANPNYNPNYSGNSEDIKTPYWKYNGLGQLLLDLMYLEADTNRHAAQANIGSLKAQAVAGEILAAIGVPATEKVVPLRIDSEVKTLRYPAFNANGQTLADLLIWILQNLAIQNEG